MREIEVLSPNLKCAIAKNDRKCHEIAIFKTATKWSRIAPNFGSDKHIEMILDSSYTESRE